MKTDYCWCDEDSTVAKIKTEHSVMKTDHCQCDKDSTADAMKTTRLSIIIILVYEDSKWVKKIGYEALFFGFLGVVDGGI